MTPRPVLAAALLLSLAACARRVPAPALRLEPGSALAAAGEVLQTGEASWYGGDFHGRLTAAGEVYDMHKLTAAHPDLPFHTLLEVENLENGRRVLVRVNDRGPFLKGRIIDLSLKAAQRLGMAESGTARVSLRLLRRGTALPPEAARAAAPPPEAPPPAAHPAGTGCYVQAGAFSGRENAEDLLLTVAEALPGMGFRIIAEDGLYKVVSPRLEPAAACAEALRRLSAFGLPAFVRSAPPPGEG
jgi:hypothetical protein